MATKSSNQASSIYLTQSSSPPTATDPLIQKTGRTLYVLIIGIGVGGGAIGVPLGSGADGPGAGVADASFLTSLTGPGAFGSINLAGTPRAATSFGNTA